MVETHNVRLEMQRSSLMTLLSQVCEVLKRIEAQLSRLNARFQGIRSRTGGVVARLRFAACVLESVESELVCIEPYRTRWEIVLMHTYEQLASIEGDLIGIEAMLAHQ